MGRGELGMCIFNKRAEAGIGTLILFIAMILVAAVAASVLISTSNSLQTRALSTGSQAKDQVTTSIQFLNIYGDDASSDGTVENFYLELKLVSGSDIIKLEDAVVEFTMSENTTSLGFGSSGSCSSGLTATTFKTEYLINGSQNIPGYIASGDVVQICFSATRSITEDEQIEFTVIPKTGSLATAGITTPSVMTEKTVYLYP